MSRKKTKQCREGRVIQAEGTSCTKALWWRIQETKRRCSLLHQREMGKMVTWTSLEWKGGTKPCSLEGHVKEFCLFPKITGYSIKFQMQYVAKRNCLHLGLWFLLLYFLFFSWMMSSIQNLKQKHGNFHLLPHSVGHYGQSILPPIYASNVCHFYHCCLIQTSFFSDLHH